MKQPRPPSHAGNSRLPCEREIPSPSKCSWVFRPCYLTCSDRRMRGCLKDACTNPENFTTSVHPFRGETGVKLQRGFSCRLVSPLGSVHGMIRLLDQGIHLLSVIRVDRQSGTRVEGEIMLLEEKRLPDASGDAADIFLDPCPVADS